MPLLKRQIGRALIGGLSWSGVARWNRRSSATVFCYHNVVADDIDVAAGEAFLHVRLSDFRQQVEWIRKTLTVIPLGELADRVRLRRPIGGLAALTFDDGYTGVARHAVPVMRGAGFPFTVFPVIRGSTDRTPFWWDIVAPITPTQREHNISVLKGDAHLITAQRTPQPDLPDDMLPASWATLRAMLGDDSTIGVHGATHRCLTAIPTDQMVWELTYSRERIADELGVTADMLAYPYGRTNAHVQAVAKRTGFRVGMSTDFGLLRPGAELLRCARINVPAGILLPSFSCWASGLRLPGG